MVRRLFLGVALVAALAAPTAAGPTWTLDASESTYAYVCGDGDEIAIRGHANAVTVSGECGRLEVVGSDNRIVIEGVAAIRITGDNNDVAYQRVTGGGKKPATRIKGAANTVRRRG
jgi:hypothetical protein